MKTKKDLLQEIQALREELQNRKDALPAHSIRPHQLMGIEELEEEIERKEKLLQEIQESE
ncbi:MAG: hypothetical protein DRG71_07435 [Deltaproteobacteria bacterium]|nr:MAG: hypothetical protein DRG71_07435 [Deltaproteobacteria bacterium]